MSKWLYWKLWNFALEGVTSFSIVPLRVATYVGFVSALAVFRKLCKTPPVVCLM